MTDADPTHLEHGELPPRLALYGHTRDAYDRLFEDLHDRRPPQFEGQRKQWLDFGYSEEDIDKQRRMPLHLNTDDIIFKKPFRTIRCPYLNYFHEEDGSFMVHMGEVITPPSGKGGELVIPREFPPFWIPNEQLPGNNETAHALTEEHGTSVGLLAAVQSGVITPDYLTDEDCVFVEGMWDSVKEVQQT